MKAEKEYYFLLKGTKKFKNTLRLLGISVDKYHLAMVEYPEYKNKLNKIFRFSEKIKKK